MRWSWLDLQAAPAAMVDEIQVMMEARAQVEREQSRKTERR